MAGIYYKIDPVDTTKVYFSNEHKYGYTLRTYENDARENYDNPTCDRTVIIEPLDDGSFTLPYDSRVLFYNIRNTSIDTSFWNTSECELYRSMFSNCKKLTSLDLSSWDTSNATNMMFMFNACTGLTSLDLSDLDVSNVTDMGGMFDSCTGLTSVDVSWEDTSSLSSINNMFKNCTRLESVDLSSWKTSNLTSMTETFRGCTSLRSIDMSDWDTTSLQSMTRAFYQCSGLSELDLSWFSTPNLTTVDDTFSYCSALTTIKATDNFVITSIEYPENDVFYGCNLLAGGDGTVYNSSLIDATYARIDRLPGSPGYFTGGDPTKWRAYEVWVKENNTWRTAEAYI